MPDIPRDPRQLARDILAGKVRIEDLARQRQGGVPPQQQARVPDKIPLPRPVPPRQVPRPQQPVQRGTLPVPARQPQKPARRQGPPPVVRQTPTPIRTPVPPPTAQPAPRTAYTLAPQAPSPNAPTAPNAPETMASAMAQKTKPVRKTVLLAKLMRGKDALKNGILLAEVLGKPVSERNL